MAVLADQLSPHVVRQPLDKDCRAKLACGQQFDVPPIYGYGFDWGGILRSALSGGSRRINKGVFARLRMGCSEAPAKKG